MTRPARVTKGGAPIEAKTGKGWNVTQNVDGCLPIEDACAAGRAAIEIRHRCLFER